MNYPIGQILFEQSNIDNFDFNSKHEFFKFENSLQALTFNNTDYEGINLNMETKDGGKYHLYGTSLLKA